MGYLFWKILWYPRSRSEWDICFEKYYGTHDYEVSGVFFFQKYYGTHGHGVSGIFVFKNIMVPTITEWVGYYGTHDHKASGILWYPRSQSEWDIMVSTITKWVGYLFSKILWYPRSRSEWDICFQKYYGALRHGVSGIFVFKNIMVPTVMELVGYLISKIVWCPPSRSEWGKWATSVFLRKRLSSHPRYSISFPSRGG
jgi:hypothetical protein